MNFESIKKKLITFAKQNDDIDAMWLYGSRAKGNYHENSDIDLAVLFKTASSNLLERRLRSELLALEWAKNCNLQEGELSVLDIKLSPIPLSMGVLKTGEMLLNKAPDHEFRVSRSIMSQWEIDYEYHYKHMG